MARIVFSPSEVSIATRADETLFQLAADAGVKVNTACVGKGNCGLCRVKVEAGEEALGPFGTVEGRHLGNVYFITKERLACQTRIVDPDVDVRISVPPPRVRKSK